MFLQHNHSRTLVANSNRNCTQNDASVGLHMWLFQSHSPPIPARHLHPNLSTTAAEAAGSPRCIAVLKRQPSTENYGVSGMPSSPRDGFCCCWKTKARLVMGREAQSEVDPALFFFNNINYPVAPNPGLTMHDMLRILVYGPQTSCRIGCLMNQGVFMMLDCC